MTDKTVAGISFGDNSDNGNTGYLCLQMVPHTLDFGNHKLLNNSKRDFTADGKNTTLASNDLAASYDNTAYGRTQKVFELTKDANDASWVTDSTAADGEGQGANVFGWAPQDIKLTMPQGAQVNNAIYKANLTWTLSSTAA